MRLFNKGDSISDEAKRAKLKREYKKLNDLSQLIYWSDVGREGAKHFEQLLQQKKMAQRMHATIAGDISVEKAQKMIAKAIEVQKKADAARAAKLYKSASSASASRHASSRKQSSARGDRQTFRPNRGRHRTPFPVSSLRRGNRAKASERSGRGVKRSHSGGHA